MADIPHMDEIEVVLKIKMLAKPKPLCVKERMPHTQERNKRSELLTSLKVHSSSKSSTSNLQLGGTLNMRPTCQLCHHALSWEQLTNPVE